MRSFKFQPRFFGALLVAAFFGGCPAPAPDDAGPGDGDGDGDGDTIEAMITASPTVPLGGPLALSASETLNPEGRALTYAWSVVDEPELDCAGAFSPAPTDVDVALTPSCLGEYRVLLDVSTVADTEPLSSVFATITVIRPDNHIVIIAPVDDTVLRGFPVSLDGSDTIAASDETLSYAWTAEGPEAGCGDDVFDDAAATTPVFTPACQGMHTLTLTASDSISSNAGTVTLNVQPSLVVSFGMVMEAPFPTASSVALLLDEDSIPAGRAADVTFNLTAAPIDDAAEATIAVDAEDARRFDVVPGSSRAGYTLSATATLDDVSTTPAATQQLNVPNALPTVMGAVPDAPFDTGDIVTATAAVSDADGDVLTCTASLLDAELLPVTAPPSITSAMVVDDACVVVVDTVGASDAAWTLRVDVDDGMGGVAFSENSLVPNNEAPVIQPIPAAMVGYACDGSACATAPVLIVIDAMDSKTAPEDLTYAVALESAPGAVSGVTLAATPTGMLGEFSLVLSRDSLGAMTEADEEANYVSTVTVTDTPLDEGLPVATDTTLFNLRVISSPPDIDDISIAGADPINHTYDSASAEYRAEASTTWTNADPEGNTVTTSAVITSCPAAGCGNSTLVITAGDGSTGEITAGLAAAVISDVVGSYTISISAVDVDGETDESTVDYTVTNRGPSVTGGFASEVNHTYDTTRYLLSLPYKMALSGATDPDGDPLMYDQLVMACPPGTSSVTDGSGFTCNGDDFGFSSNSIEVVSFTPAHVDNVTYTLSGTVSDGLATAGPSLALHSWTAVDRAPIFSDTFSLGNVVSRHHRYVNGNIELASAETLVGDVADPDGDPMTPFVRVSTENCGSTTTWKAANEQMTAQVTCPWANRNEGHTVVPGVSTVFGDFDEPDSYTFRFNNRLPIVDTVNWRHEDGTQSTGFAIFGFPGEGYATPTIVSDISVGTPTRKRQYLDLIDYSYLHPSCGTYVDFPNAPFGLYIDAEDPDGDPIASFADITCGDNRVLVQRADVPPQFPPVCSGIEYNSPTERSLPPNKTLPFHVLGPAQSYNRDCNAADGVSDSYQDLIPSFNQFGRVWLQCALNGPTSYVTDNFGSSGTNLTSSTRDFTFDADTNNTCYMH